MPKHSYQELQAQARDLGIASHGVKAPALAELIRKAQAPDVEFDAPPEEAAAAADFDRGDRVPIHRTNALGHWWCPVCDHSATGLVNECRGCGAVRDGDEVIAP